MTNLFENTDFMDIIFSLVAALPLLVGGVLTKYVLYHIKNDKIRRLLSGVSGSVAIAVREVGQTYVDAIKEGRADGKLTEDEKANARYQAISRAKYLMGKEVMRLITSLLGIAEHRIDDWLGSHIEAEVAERKSVNLMLPLSTPRDKAEG